MVWSRTRFALSLPGTQPKNPWPGHDDVAVNDKTFLYLGSHEDQVSVGVTYSWSGSLRERERRGPSLHGISYIAGAFR